MKNWFLSLSYLGVRMSMIGVAVICVGVGDGPLAAGSRWFGVGCGLVAGGLLSTALTPWGRWPWTRRS